MERSLEHVSWTLFIFLDAYSFEKPIHLGKDHDTLSQADLGKMGRRFQSTSVSVGGAGDRQV